MIAHFLHFIQHWLAIHTGTLNESGPYYGFWSGFGSDLGEISLLGGMLMAYKHLQCHDMNCRRFGFHHIGGTPFKTCKRHHPTGGNTVDQIHAAHREANRVSEL